MDLVMAGVDPKHPKAGAVAERELRRVAPVCRWTRGQWEGMNGLPWDDLEYTGRHIRTLSNLLVRTYVQAKGGRPA
jgi:hypothetical protein